MATFVIETTCRVPHYRSRTYHGDTLEIACQEAIVDDDWKGHRVDEETAGPTYVTGAWTDPDVDGGGHAVAYPSNFLDPAGRKDIHFEPLFRALKTAVQERSMPIQTYIAICNAEAILAGEPYPDARALGDTPWGQADDVRVHAKGILFYQTPSHGGFHLDTQCNALIPDHWRNADGWYEEDSEWAKVAVTFEWLVDAENLERARKIIAADQGKAVS